MLCYSVRLASMERISPLAFKAIDFNGNTDIIPASQVMGRDYGVEKSDAWWISAWILEKKCITYTSKKRAFFDKSGKMLPNIEITKHTPKKVEPIDNNIINKLAR